MSAALILNAESSAIQLLQNVLIPSLFVLGFSLCQKVLRFSAYLRDHWRKFLVRLIVREDASSALQRPLVIRLPQPRCTRVYLGCIACLRRRPQDTCTGNWIPVAVRLAVLSKDSSCAHESPRNTWLFRSLFDLIEQSITDWAKLSSNGCG